MSNLKNIIVSVLVAAVVALGIGAVVRPSLPAGILVDAGASAQTFGATAASLSSVVFSHLTNLQVNQNLGVVGTFFGGAPAVNGNTFQTNWSVGSCNTATSTLFSVAPPSGATSTVTEFLINGIVAQTSDIVVGTSTLSSVTSTSSLNVTGAGGLVGAAAVATGQFYTVAGLKVGPGKGYTTNGNGGYNTVPEMVVGPTENVIGFATSTAVTGGQGVTSCTYKIEWQN